MIEKFKSSFWKGFTITGVEDHLIWSLGKKNGIKYLIFYYNKYCYRIWPSKQCSVKLEVLK